jgi:hypothetical protein
MFRASPHAQVAQLVEQRIENPRVGGSIPPLGTISPSHSSSSHLILLRNQQFMGY